MPTPSKERKNSKIKRVGRWVWRLSQGRCRFLTICTQRTWISMPRDLRGRLSSSKLGLLLVFSRRCRMQRILKIQHRLLIWISKSTCYPSRTKWLLKASPRQTWSSKTSCHCIPLAQYRTIRWINLNLWVWIKIYLRISRLAVWILTWLLEGSRPRQECLLVFLIVQSQDSLTQTCRWALRVSRGLRISTRGPCHYNRICSRGTDPTRFRKNQQI